MIGTRPPGSEGLPALMVRYTDRMAGYLRRQAPGVGTRTGLMTAYHMGWVDPGGRPREAPAGKLVRPSLCLWACEATGGDVTSALPAAAALEWVHNFTLIHDDIQDGDRERHHRPTVWSIWGVAQGINAGDALHAMAFESLLAPGPHPGRRLRAARALARAVLEVIEGQCLDLGLEGRPHCPPASYLRMARAKTGALLGASLQLGAIMGGARPAAERTLRAAGRLLGLSFQVRDDWLGIWGEPALTGKSRDCDLGRRKVTYPVVVGYAAMPPAERRRFRALFRSEPDGVAAVEALRDRLEAAGARERSAAAARGFARQAIEVVAGSGLGPEHTEQFQELAHYVANRTR
ncbi:MAG TPA: polyprenyl synthetase family protein [Candidatus Dormibacteraeota bacterium]|nr:polyprenyl synthetase family protein [Candidatus Dormibacteraeota bacterium]